MPSEAKQESIGFSYTLALNSRTTFPVKSVGISCRVTGPLKPYFLIYLHYHKNLIIELRFNERGRQIITF